MKRSCGVLLPVASLPSDHGIGTFGKEAYRFIDTLVAAGQSYWQILPLGPTGYGDSPYQSFSTFAGNPYYIDLDFLKDEGLLKEAEIKKAGLDEATEKVDYEAQYKRRFPLLRKAYVSSPEYSKFREGNFDVGNVKVNKEFDAFYASSREWLVDYALFMAVKDANDGKSYFEWEDGIRSRDARSIKENLERYGEDVFFYIYLQFKFQEQWEKLRKYAGEKGVKIIGDIPIYVALDSSDSWSHPELFQFDKEGQPIAVAGCPPDAFSETGQLWGNPLYNWDKHRETGYAWWLERLSRCFQWYDMVRIDHFRGFDEYYSIPFGDPTAVNGKWEKGPGIELFQAMEQKIGKQEIIAEDLGFLTDSVKKMLRDTGYPGMKVLQFAFDSREESDYMPHNYDKNCVVYTGTHDNTTTFSWWKSELPRKDKEVALRYLDLPTIFLTNRKLTWQLIVFAERSVADLCIIPAWDFLMLDKEARINTPSTLGNNWCWRMEKNAFGAGLCYKIREMCRLYGRTPRDN